MSLEFGKCTPRTPFRKFARSVDSAVARCVARARPGGVWTGETGAAKVLRRLDRVVHAEVIRALGRTRRDGQSPGGSDWVCRSE